MRLALICACLCLIRFAPPAAAQSVAPGGPEANPGRPTVSTPATLTPVGYFQFETGVLGANHSPEFSSRFGLNEVIKFSVAPRLQLLASGEPIAHFTANGMAANQIADVFLGAQTVVYRGEGAKPTIAASYFRRVYDGARRNWITGAPPTLSYCWPAPIFWDFITTPTPSSTNSFKSRYAELNLARRFPFPTVCRKNSASRGRSGTLRSHFFAAMPWAIFGLLVYSRAENTGLRRWLQPRSLQAHPRDGRSSQDSHICFRIGYSGFCPRPLDRLEH